MKHKNEKQQKKNDGIDNLIYLAIQNKNEWHQ